MGIEVKRKDVPQCCEQVRDGGRWPSYHQCTRKGIVERDGKQYCKQHDPVAVKAKADAKAEEWAERNREWDEQTRRRTACVNACSGIPTAALEAGVVGELVAALEQCVGNGDLHPNDYDKATTALARARGVANGD